MREKGKGEKELFSVRRRKKSGMRRESQLRRCRMVETVLRLMEKKRKAKKRVRVRKENTQKKIQRSQK